jgi:hypothetical protein
VRARDGVALFAALAVIVLVALLVGGALASLRFASRSSELATTDAELTAAADFALTSVVSNARALGLDTMSLGVGHTVPLPPSSANGVVTTVVATRLTGGVAWLVAEATQTGLARGRRRINLVARWQWPGAAPPAPLVAKGNVHLASVTFVPDTTGDAECRGSQSADVAVAPGASVGPTAGTSVLSTPVAGDSAAYLLAPGQLAQFAVGGGVIHVMGDTTITGGVLQGILIVDGALTITGPFTVTGLVIARRSIVATSGGLVVTGALMSFAPVQTSVPAIDLGPSIIRFSRCVISAAFRRAVPLRPVHERSWAELF